MTIDKIHDLSVSNYGTARSQKYDIAILPWGATEPHNLHLPYLTDAILSHDIAVDAAQIAQEKYSVMAMVMPPVTLGSQNPGQRELAFCVHARYETQRAILTDIAASLYQQGIRRLLIVNGHGGNSFKNMIRDLSIDMPDMLIATSEWFKMCPAKEYFEAPDDHAEELETSVMMHYHPELVNLNEAGDGHSGGFRPETLKKGLAWIPRNWQRVSIDTGIGSPKSASALKGKNFAEAVADRYADLLRDLCTPESELYEPLQ